MQYRLFAAIFPFDSDASPIRFRDNAFVGLVFLPANFVADLELSGVFAGHFFTISTRFISP